MCLSSIIIVFYEKRGIFPPFSVSIQRFIGFIATHLAQGVL